MKVTSKVAPSNSQVLDLGEFGHVADVPEEQAWPEPPKFPWFGTEIRVHPMLSDTLLVDLVEESGELDDNSPQAGVVLKKFIRNVIHPDDFEDFWKLGKAHGYHTMKFAQVAALIIEQVTGDPTQESTDSSNGPLPTATKSPGVSSKLTRTVEELEAEGRPDLAEFFIIAQEAGVSR